jgi:hypothetical protein
MSKRAIVLIPVVLPVFIVRLLAEASSGLPSFAAFLSFRPAGFPCAFDEFTMPRGFQRSLKRHD